MTNEEKEARYLINVLEDKKFTAQGEALRTYIEELNKNIDKLQKENEVLKEVHKEFATLCRELKTDDTLMSAKSVMEKVVSKDKIRNKIKELEKTKNYIISMYAIGILEELLGDDE